MRFTPYPHQVIGTKFLVDNNGGAIFSEPRTGKSLIISRWIEQSNFKRVLIIAPNPVLASWYGTFIEDGISADKIKVFDNLRGRKVSELRHELSSNSYNYFIISYSRIESSNALEVRDHILPLLEVESWDCVILDESYAIASFDSNISKYILSVPKPKNQYRAILTGTPICESALDVVQPYIFLYGEFFGFKDAISYRFAKYREYGFNWVVKSKIHSAKVESFVKKNSFQVKLSELNLGGEIFHNLSVVTSSEIIEKWLAWLRTTTVYEHNITGEVMELIPPVKVMFAQKICAGINPLNNELFDFTKTEWIVDLLELDFTPSLILSRFTKPLRDIQNKLIGKGFNVGLIDGSVDLQERERLRVLFQNGELDIIVAQEEAVARGLDFSRLGRIINHSNGFSYETRGQKILRGQNVKRTEPYEVIDVCIDKSVDIAVVNKLFNKEENVSKFIKEFVV